MQPARRFCAADGDLGDFGGEPPRRQGRNGGAQRFQRDGGDAEAGLRVFGQHSVHHGLHAALGAAEENGVRGGQSFQRLGGFPFDEGQIPGCETLPVLPDKRAGLRVAFHGIDPPARGGKGQFHTDTAGAGPHIPQRVRGADGQLCQRGSADFLLRHGNVSPEKGFVREPGTAPGRLGQMFDEQNAQGCRAFLRNFLRGAEEDLLLR